MPGMAASPKIFEFIIFPAPFVIHYLSWIPPNKNETLSAYALRMCKRVKQPNPILLGVSFGGLLVQEMAKLIVVDKVVIVSSIKLSASCSSQKCKYRGIVYRRRNSRCY